MHSKITLKAPEPLDPQKHNRSSFSCGVAQLDVFLREKARKESPDFSRTFVITCTEEPREILGYHSVSATNLRLDDFPDDLRKKLPRYEALGATLLGRLAVAEQVQRDKRPDLRIGELLLLDAQYRAWLAAQSVASCGIVVKVLKGEKGDPTRFYEKYGFTKCAQTPDLLWLPMKTIEKTLIQAGLIS